MPLILAPTDYVRWLSDEYDPRDLMRPLPSRADADVADIYSGQQARERRSLNRRAYRIVCCVRRHPDVPSARPSGLRITDQRLAGQFQVWLGIIREKPERVSTLRQSAGSRRRLHGVRNQEAVMTEAKLFRRYAKEAVH